AKLRPFVAVTLAALILFGALGYWKYSAFIVRVLQDLGFRGAWMDGLSQPLTLPLGISFIVFQGLGYVIDVAAGRKSAEPRWSTVILFKAYFPQLIAGPICRANELIPQLKEYMSFQHGRFASGLAILGVGLFFKVVFADNVSPFVDRYFMSPAGMNTAEAWFAVLGFSVQILADFWGYSTMAYGISLMVGITLPINFRLPYLACSLREFWRRWHITLSTWLRDYLYKSFGGSRHGYARTIGALVATMVIGGLWHGANYTFLAWGLLHGLALALEHGFVKLRDRLVPDFALFHDPRAVSLSKGLTWIYAMTVVLVGWVFFRAANVGEAVEVLRKMTADLPTLEGIPRSYATLILGFFVVQVIAERLLQKLRNGTIPPHWCYPLTVWLIIVSVVMSSENAEPFIYFQF
ncbi:MAG: MBOAT family O-acyltransferase, partial [Pyrinomonadaceae bacterium]